MRALLDVNVLIALLYGDIFTMLGPENGSQDTGIGGVDRR